MIKLAKFLKPYLLSVIAAPLFMFLEVLMDTYLPRLMAGIVDVGVANRDLDYVLRIGVQMVLMALVGVIGGVGCTIFSSLAGQNFGRDVRSAPGHDVGQNSCTLWVETGRARRSGPLCSSCEPV